MTSRLSKIIFFFSLSLAFAQGFGRRDLAFIQSEQIDHDLRAFDMLVEDQLVTRLRADMIMRKELYPTRPPASFSKGNGPKTNHRSSDEAIVV